MVTGRATMGCSGTIWLGCRAWNGHERRSPSSRIVAPLANVGNTLPAPTSEISWNGDMFRSPGASAGAMMGAAAAAP